MQIYIITPQGKTILMDVILEKTTVEEMKRKLMEKIGLPVEDMILIYQEKILTNGKKLYQFQIDTKLELETVQSFFDKLNQKSALLNEEKIIMQEQTVEERLEKERYKKSFLEIQQKLIDNEQQKKILEAETKEARTEIQQLESKLEAALRNNKMTTTLGQSQQLQQGDEEKQQITQQMQQMAELSMKVQMMEMDKLYRDQSIDQLREEKKQLLLKLEESAKIKEELMEKKYEIRVLERENWMLQQSGDQNQKGLMTELQRYKELDKSYQAKIKEQEDKIQHFEMEQIKIQYSQPMDTSFVVNEMQNKLSQAEKRNEDFRVQIASLNQQIINLQTTQQNDMTASVRNKIEQNTQLREKELRQQISRLQSELNAKSNAFQDSQTQVSTLKKQLYDFGRKEKEQEASIDSMKQMLREKDKKYKEREEQVKYLNEEIADYKSDIQKYQQQVAELRNIVRNTGNPNQIVQIDSNIINTKEAIEKREQLRGKQEMEAKERDSAINAQRANEMKNEKLQMQELMKMDKVQRQKAAQVLKKQMMETHGKIEVCLLVDVTQSMDPYKEQAMKCIKESIKSIKIKTNRDALWAAVAYQDFGELKQLGGLYKQINFTSNAVDVEKFLRDQPCVGGGDYAEDIRGGIKQMITNLTWSKTFKIAVLICDAPTHGKKYNAGVSDIYPTEDIEDAIKMLIDNNVLLVGILFNKITLTMFEELKKIYATYDREELLLFADLANTEKGRIWQELVDLVSQASMRATQTNNKGTKSKNAEANKRSQSGAMEALCKTLKNPFEFDKQPGVKTVGTNFKIMRVDMKQDVFESNIENLKNIQLPRDYQVFQEGEWNCIRTDKFFAQGQMKQVFLMKRQSNQKDLYVIKMPLRDSTYQTLESAIYECRSHLIAKCLMRKFIRELQEARNRSNPSLKFPNPIYSDFLILQDQPNSFWIAERFFSGEFVKYNNNYGFISDDNDQLNHIAQAYTYYTYFISNFNYMISDVKGVGQFFTDPAINTKEGSYDDTDMGQDGQAMFIVAYEGKRQMGQHYLDLLGIHYE